MIHASVDLPEPLPPWISSPSPWCTVKLTSRNAVFAHGVPLPYSCPTPASSSTGAPESWPIAAVACRRGGGLDHVGVVPGIAEIDCVVSGIGFVVVVRDVDQRRAVLFLQAG